MNELLYIHNVSVIRIGEKSPKKILFKGNVFKTMRGKASCSDCDFSTYCRRRITTVDNPCVAYLATPNKKQTAFYLNALKFVE